MASNFPIHHGIRLAGGGYVENFYVETLSTDPVPVSAGRIWFNDTDGAFKKATLDNTGAVVVRTFATYEQLHQEILDEQAARIAGDAQLASDLADETAARIAGDAQLASDLAAEVSARQAAVAAEASARSSADTTLTNNLNSEISRAQAAEAQLTSDLAAEASTRAANDTTITNNLNSEISRAQGAEAQLASDLADEVARAEAAESALDGRVTSIENSYIKKDGTVAMTGDLDLDSHIVKNLSTPVNSGDAVNKAYVDALVGTLGSAFNYVGTVAGGADAASAYDMATLPAGGKDTGDYYKVSQSGYFKVGAGAAFFANANDGLVFNTVGGVDKIDSTDSTVTGTSDYIAVTGSTDTGYTIDIDSVFKGRVSTLEGDLLAEVARAEAAEGVLQSNIDAEASARAAADTTITNNLNSEISRAQAAEGVLQSNIDAEASARAAAVTAEANARIAADNSEASTRAAADTTLQNNIDAEAATRSSADATLQSNIDAEAAARAAADSSEASARAAADTTLQSNIDAEAAARAAADSAEASARAAADTTLQSNIDAEASARAAADSAEASARAAADSAEASARAAADTQIRSDFNALRFTYESTTAATTHTVTHNLNSSFVDFTVMVQRDDMSWRNDVVSVEHYSDNVLKVYLSVAKNIRISVTSMASI